MTTFFTQTNIGFTTIKNNIFTIKLSSLCLTSQPLKQTILLKKDKIKIIVISILVGLLATCFFIFGQDAPQMKYASGFCLIAWLATMFIVNKKYS